MPYSSITSPSLALGLLDTYISEMGYNVDTVYGNLMFAKTIGLAEYEFLNSSFNEYLIGEWTFSRPAFADQGQYPATDDDAFFALFADMTEEIKQQLLVIRDKASLFIRELAASILAKNPKVVGCTSTFQQNCASLALLRKIKATNPDIVTLMGGANCEGIMGQTISEHFDWVDYVFSGESDDVIGGFIDKLMRGVAIGRHNLPSGFITQKLNAIVTDDNSAEKSSKTPPRAYLGDMTKVGMPNFDSYFAALQASGISEAITPGLVIETSRGCWWGAKQHCTFCGLNGVSMTHRSKLPAVAVDEFTQLSAKYDINKFMVVDNILPVEYMNTVLPQMAEQKQQYNIFYEIKANLKKEQVEKLAKAGVRWVQPGIEGLQDDFLRTIKKGCTAIQNLAALKWFRAYGIRVAWNLLCGAPFEKEHWYEEVAQWLPWVEHLHPPLNQLVTIRYHRFSPYFNNPQQYDLTLEPLKSYQYIYPSLNQQGADKTAQDLFNIAYFFEQASSQNKGIFNLKFTFRGEMAAQQKVQKQLEQWSHAWHSGTPPILYMEDKGDKIVILDTRKVATSFTHTLQGLTATVYRLCAEPVAKARLSVKLANLVKADKPGEQVDEAVLDDILAQLIANKLLIHLSKCYMALAFVAESTQMLKMSDSPAGCVHLDKVF
ncbi:MAG: RiPP maturation radical SAM C-methyltransferase [Psychrosphaera sp.]|nr:RiPP maturation radical SAM C-methyltransferase [Psychrosphaera sp.]